MSQCSKVFTATNCFLSLTTWIQKVPTCYTILFTYRMFFSQQAILQLCTSFQAFDLEWGWRWPSCDIDQYLFSILQTSLHLKGSKVCIMIRSPLASLLFKGLATKHATVNWTIQTPSPKNSGNCTNLSAGPKVLPRCNIKLHVP